MGKEKIKVMKKGKLIEKSEMHGYTAEVRNEKSCVYLYIEKTGSDATDAARGWLFNTKKAPARFNLKKFDNLQAIAVPQFYITQGEEGLPLGETPKFDFEWLESGNIVVVKFGGEIVGAAVDVKSKATVYSAYIKKTNAYAQGFIDLSDKVVDKIKSV